LGESCVCVTTRTSTTQRQCDGAHISATARRGLVAHTHHGRCNAVAAAATPPTTAPHLPVRKVVPQHLKVALLPLSCSVALPQVPCGDNGRATAVAAVRSAPSQRTVGAPCSSSSDSDSGSRPARHT
jgi:hypothetical protein